MRFSRASLARSVATVVAACSTAGCSMIGADFSGPVLPGTLVAILAFLGGIFAVAWSRYAHRGDISERAADRRTNNVA